MYTLECRSLGLVGFPLLQMVRTNSYVALAVMGLTFVVVELLPLTGVSTSVQWIDMTNARKQQQETYTSIVRRTRGPKVNRSGR